MKILNAGKNARVVTKMSETCRKALKMYAAAFHRTSSEVLYEATRCMLHTQAQTCDVTQAILDNCGIPPDKRVGRPCFGYSCMACKHQTACRTGLYKGVCEIDEEYIAHVNPVGAASLQAMQKAWRQAPQNYPQLPQQKNVPLAHRSAFTRQLK